jgi:hypothetical protein
MAGGLTMQYMWTAWRPASGNVELLGHAGLYYTGGLNTDYDLIEPQARDDNYVLLVGFFLLMETSDLAQRILSNHLFMWLGERSLSKCFPSASLSSTRQTAQLCSRSVRHRLFSPFQHNRLLGRY